MDSKELDEILARSPNAEHIIAAMVTDIAVQLTMIAGFIGDIKAMLEYGDAYINVIRRDL